MKLTIEPKEDNQLGLSSTMLTGDDGKYEVTLTCGAGVGNDILSFRLKSKDGKHHITENANLSPIFREWFEAKIKEIEGNETTAI